MRVLVVGPLGPDSPAENLTTSLQDLGHDARGVETWDWDARLSNPKTHASRPLPFLGSFELHAVNELERRPGLAARLQAGVVAAAEEHQPELTIVMDRSLSVGLVPRLKSASGGAPVALWFFDSLRAIGRETYLLGGYDAVFVTDEPSARRYRDIRGLNAHLMPEACNPRWHRPPDGAAPGDAGTAVLLLGSVYTSRYLLLRRLFDAGIEIELRGGHVSRVIPPDRRLDAARAGDAVVREAKARAFRRAAVVLNDVNTAETSHLNLRLFEAAGVGGRDRDGVAGRAAGSLRARCRGPRLPDVRRAARADPRRSRATRRPRLPRATRPASAPTPSTPGGTGSTPSWTCSDAAEHPAPPR